MANSEQFVLQVIEKARLLEQTARELDALVTRYERTGANAVDYLLAPYFATHTNGPDNNPITQNDFYAFLTAWPFMRTQMLQARAGDPPTGLWGKSIFDLLNKVV